METETIIITNGAPGVKYTNGVLTYTPLTPLSIDGKLVALRDANLYKSWRNITAAYGNNAFSYIYNSTTYSVALPDGNYTYADLSAYLTQIQVANGHYLIDPNGNTVTFLSLTLNATAYALSLTCTPWPTALTGAYANYTNPALATLTGTVMQLVVPAGMKAYFGFQAGTYPTTALTTLYSVNSTLAPQVDVITNIFVSCDVANSGSSYIPSTIAQLNPTSAVYGSQLVYAPRLLSYYPTAQGPATSINIRLYDQTGTATLPLIDTTTLSFTLMLVKRTAPPANI